MKSRSSEAESTPHLPDSPNPIDIFRFYYEFRFKRARWPRWIESEPRQVPGRRVFGETLSATFINHTSVLLQVEGINILTDPMFSERASPVSWAGPRRVRAPGIALADLPEIDVILVSHNHYDHLDIASLQAIHKQNGRPSPLILTGNGNGRLLRKHGLTCYREMKWGDSSSFGGADIHFTSARHFSGRGLRDRGEALWGAFVIRTGAGRRIYFAGDTGYGPHFRETAEAHGPFDLSLIPIGAYEPRWMMKPVHLNPAEAVQAHLDLQSNKSLATHFGTFQLTLESIDAPAAALKEALAAHGLDPSTFHIPAFGETIALRDKDLAAD